ncbi:hypothetical protein CA13_49150 [Planctomycetes bacterium CA13]|uniref:Uncharacterized protein n=1 Tax=Novipirellula herctigrandis TaxID=2527986 RepID=A0A5C5Z8C1_9BACT|nr:hypothetical protein CA13_49150 [Planctomycetes bacterium CA13]
MDGEKFTGEMTVPPVGEGQRLMCEWPGINQPVHHTDTLAFLYLTQLQKQPFCVSETVTVAC